MDEIWILLDLHQKKKKNRRERAWQPALLTLTIWFNEKMPTRDVV